MASRQSIEDAIKASEARLQRLLPMMESYENLPLLDDGGKWSVRGALSHIAASAHVTVGAQRALDRAAGKAPPPAPSGPQMSGDERNEQQIKDRMHKSIAEIVEETKQGHAKALEDVKGMNDMVLGTKVAGMGANAPRVSASGLIMRQIEYHEGGQIDRIEYAIKSKTRWL